MKAGLIIKEARLRAGLTQAALARRLATTQSVVARWETGATRPSMERVARILQATGFDLQVALVKHDSSDDGLISQQLAATPAQRLDSLLNLLEVERWAGAAHPVTPHG